MEPIPVLLLLKGQIMIFNEERTRNRRDRCTIVIRTQRQFFHAHIRKCKNDYTCKDCTDSMRNTYCRVSWSGKLPAFTKPTSSLPLTQQPASGTRWIQCTLSQPVYWNCIFLGTFANSLKASVSFVTVLLPTWQRASNINSPSNHSGATLNIFILLTVTCSSTIHTESTVAFPVEHG
jgi:hypothetical protein